VSVRPGRRRAREFALQALYAADVGGSTGPVGPDETEFATELVRGVMEDREAIDARIEAASEHWRLARMPVVDRNILRLGTWELQQRADIPASVTINEAIELAKRFGGAESRAFVNGLLDRIAGDLGRGGRRKK
jgi:N utilization substance protein B